MNKTYLEKLEYNKILNILSNYCITYIGKNYCNNLVPSNNTDTVKLLLNETNEALSILYKEGMPPISEIVDISKYLKVLNSSGTLSLKAILELTNILNISSNLKKYFDKDFIIKDNYSILKELFSNLYTNNSLYNKIIKTVIDENTISDDASQHLSEIRRKQRKTEQNIKNTLNKIIHSHSKYIQDNIVTIRNDRYVIPIKEEYRSQIKGLIHDISSTGSTIFIEPLSVFELNNELNNLKIEEKIEIEHIINDLCLSIMPYTNYLSIDSKIIGKLDFIFAKAKYSKNLNGTCPIINKDKFINLKNVKHPLIDKNYVVPINISIGQNYSSLIITGPNTGGKTVTLKTVRSYLFNGLQWIKYPSR